MAKKNEFLVFDVFTGKFVDELPDDISFNEYMDIVNAEKEIALKIIKAKLDKIVPSDYKESKD